MDPWRLSTWRGPKFAICNDPKKCQPRPRYRILSLRKKQQLKVMFSMPKVASILVNPYDQTSNSGENYTLRKSGYIFLDAPLPPEMISGRKT